MGVVTHCRRRPMNRFCGSHMLLLGVPQKRHFLRAIAECFARLSHGLDVCPSVCLSVRHTLQPYQNGTS